MAVSPTLLTVVATLKASFGSGLRLLNSSSSMLVPASRHATNGGNSSAQASCGTVATEMP
jgi:hypothetical protein